MNKNLLLNRTFNYSISSIKIIKKLPKDYIYIIIYKQLIRSITSIGANVTEAQGSPSKKDFAYFFSIALKSAIETKY